MVASFCKLRSKVLAIVYYTSKKQQLVIVCTNSLFAKIWLIYLKQAHFMREQCYNLHKFMH